MSNDRPRKAYYVERIGRTVTTVLVFAHNGRDAQERVRAGRGVGVASNTEVRGVGRVHRAEDEDES